MRVAFRLLASRADAEDAVQDTYLRALAPVPLPQIAMEIPMEIESECARAQRSDQESDVEEATVGLYWRAIEARDPGPLMRLLQMTIATAQPTAAPAVQRSSARSASILVQVNGRYAIALMLDGVVLCIVPVGSETTTSV